MMEFDQIVVKESPGLCRCCLSEGCYKDLGSEYTWMNETEVYADMLLECFDISISQHNEGPNGPNRLICEVCITRLRDACNFKKQVLDSEKKFVDMVGRGEFRPKVMIYQAMKSENVQDTLAGEVEFLEDEIDFEDAPDEVKLDEPDPEPSASDVAVYTAKAKKRGRPKKVIPVNKPEKKAKMSKAEDKPKTSKAVVKDENSPSLYDDNISVSERRRTNLETLFYNSTIMPFKWRGRYICFYCGIACVEYSFLKSHTRTHGTCATNHITLEDVEINIDISEIACEICSESFATFDDILEHLTNDHGLKYYKINDLALKMYRLEELRCLCCEKLFYDFKDLSGHVHKFKKCRLKSYIKPDEEYMKSLNRELLARCLGSS